MATSSEQPFTPPPSFCFENNGESGKSVGSNMNKAVLLLNIITKNPLGEEQTGLGGSEDQVGTEMPWIFLFFFFCQLRCYKGL